MAAARGWDVYVWLRRVARTCVCCAWLARARCAATAGLLRDRRAPRARPQLIPKEVDVYYLKWRYYFQEFEPPAAAAPKAAVAAPAAVAASHKHLHHWVFLIDAQVNDYEEDNARYGRPSVGSISANLTAREMGLEDTPARFSNLTFYVMTPHCHAPSCIREELWDADTNTILCNVSARYGDAKYGSRNAAFNEADCELPLAELVPRAQASERVRAPPLRASRQARRRRRDPAVHLRSPAGAAASMDHIS